MTQPEPRKDTGGRTAAIVIGLAVVLLAAGAGGIMMLRGEPGADSAANPFAATPASPAPASTVFVTVAQPTPTAATEAPPSTAAMAPDAPAQAATTAAAQPAEPAVEAPAAPPQEFERYYPLVLGSQGYVVEALQDLLTWRGIRTLADGDFGPATERSVRQWQAQEGLEITGVVDDTTWDSLVPKLSEGSQGTPVEVVQNLLNAWGYAVVVDGDFGPQTNAAVREFQAWRGIPVDGVVGPITWATLLA